MHILKVRISTYIAHAAGWGLPKLWDRISSVVLMTARLLQAVSQRIDLEFEAMTALGELRR